MLLNRIEKALMNNPVRAASQRHLEARLLHTMGGSVKGRALEMGCGRGVGVRLILDVFGAEHVDGDAHRVRAWTGDAERIESADDAYDAVFDFGIIHHIPQWRTAVAEAHRVLRPGGRFYAEEVLRAFILNPVTKALLEHPLADRFDHDEFRSVLIDAGFRIVASRHALNAFGWFVAEKPELH